MVWDAWQIELAKLVNTLSIVIGFSIKNFIVIFSIFFSSMEMEASGGEVGRLAADDEQKMRFFFVRSVFDLSSAYVRRRRKKLGDFFSYFIAFVSIQYTLSSHSSMHSIAHGARCVVICPTFVSSAIKKKTRVVSVVFSFL